jgi:pentatricopeptide repeat protein
MDSASPYLQDYSTGEMRAKNLPVELATCNALLNVCAGAGDTARANEVLELMLHIPSHVSSSSYDFTCILLLM